MKRIKLEIPNEDNDQPLQIDIGGVLRTIDNGVISKCPKLKNACDTALRVNGRPYIDADPIIFNHLLNCLRRDIPFTIIPPNVLKEAWQAELIFWELDKKSDDPHNYDRIMKEKIDLVNKRMERVVFLIIELSRCITIENGATTIKCLVPQGAYNLEWDQDLFDFLLCAKTRMVDYFSKKHGSSCVYMEIMNRAQGKREDYRFNNINYNTVDTATLVFSLDCHHLYSNAKSS